MKYIAVDLNAIDEMVANRVLQSIEFELGQALVALVSGRTTAVVLPKPITVSEIGGGIVLHTNTLNSDSRFLVLDVEQSKIFNELSDGEILFVFQKLIRFAKKIWQGMTLTFAERIIANSNKAVLFPFRAYKPEPYRVVIDRDPWSDRLSKRGQKGHFLLAYKAGFESGDSNREEAELTNFRKAFESISQLKQLPQTPDATAQNDGVDQVQVLELGDGHVEKKAASLYRGFEDWLPLLTTQQRRFVEAAITGPYRIEGAAGTGKTLCLVLKAVFALRVAERDKRPYHIVFATHSDATKRSILSALDVIDDSRFFANDRVLASQSLKVCTLSELCAEQLRQSISASEFIDRDAMESKGLQLLYIDAAFAQAMATDFATHERFLSPTFSGFLKTEDPWKIVEMLQHEISVVIKGRSSDDLDRYKKMPALKYGLPILSDADKGFVFAIFRLYQAQLGEVGQFDTDDVVLTAIGQLDTPIWRRRRARDGFDAVFIDETHLFNINELHLFHYFTKTEGPFPIIYSVDRAQAVGDRGWSTDDIARTLANDESQAAPAEQSERIRTIFRSSPDIVNLAFSVVSSGATLFTNFDNPVDVAASGFTDTEERLSKQPRYLQVANEQALIESAFLRAEQLQREMQCRRSDILIVSLDSDLVKKMKALAELRNKQVLLLQKRGDTGAVEQAKQSGQLVLGHADYVGGLEFFAVVIVGVDAGRVPPAGDKNDSSKNYLSYVAHNRLYVAITRAKYRVEMLGEKARGPSKLVEPAIAADLLEVSDFE